AAGARTERIIILDDSPSMELRQGNRTLFTRATAALGDYARKLARSRPGDTLTVILTSTPDQPFLNGQILSGDRVESAASSLEALNSSAMSARFDQAFLTLLRTMEGEPAANRALYVVSDFRRHDWLSDSREGGVSKQLAALAARIPDLTLVDVGQSASADLAIIDVRSDERNLAMGVPCSLLVTIANRGARDAEAVAVTLAVDGVPAGHANLPAIAPGTSQTVSMPVTFVRAGSVTMEAELKENDQLAVDDRRGYAATVEPVIRVLVVDGEPDADAVRSESFYLGRALAPPGESTSGMGVEVVDENGFDPRNLEGVQVLFLCNVYRLTEERWRTISDWVRRGGGLVVFPGDQVDGASWNETTRAAAPGLLPVRFEEITGEASEKEWQVLRLNRPDHPVLQAFAGDRNPFLQRVKVFRYWRMEPLSDQSAVLAKFDNGRSALVESLFGTGHVLVFATAADVEWSNWPGDPSYVVTLQQVARNMARASAAARVLTVGQPLRHEVSPSLYRSEARLFAPQAQESELLRAVASSNTAVVAFESVALRQPGIWTLELATHEGEAVRVPFAANIAAVESELEGLDRSELLRRTGGDTRIHFVEGPEIPSVEEARGGQTDLTRLLVVLLLGVLMLEQGLAWWFGWRRRAG
ncbi:MAG: CARDB domain-containing protein, partial [Kiritimatiellia bacterium]